MTSPLKELEKLQLRQIEKGYYQNDTLQIRQLVDSIQLLAFENLYKNKVQQPVKVEKQPQIDEITEFYRNQYKSIDIEERSNLRTRLINQKLQEYRDRNTPKNHKRYNTTGKSAFTSRVLNRTLQQTFNDFSQQWTKQSKTSCQNREQSGFLAQLTSRTQNIIQQATITRKQDTFSYTPTNFKDEQLAMNELELGNHSFQMPKSNKFIYNQEMRILKSRVLRRGRPNILVVDQRRILD